MARGRKLASLMIRPARNGGHTVRHEFEPQLTSRTGMNGGIYNAAPPTEDHTFGPSDHSGLLKHITAALALKGLGQQAPQASPVTASAGQQQANPVEEA